MIARRLARYAPALVAALCLCAVMLASGWALALPIFLSPDEDIHYDYALTLFSAGRPLRPEENVLGRDANPVVAYLMTASHVRQQRLDANVRADPGYGSAQYFRALDAGAPAIDRKAFHDGPIVPVPYVGRLYPIAYYALAAGAIALGDAVTHGSVVGQLFFARFLSVLLLVPALVFTWLGLRELPLGPRPSLAIFACVALLPMTAWMAGYVQPDDLVCALVAASIYVALRLRRAPADTRLLAVLGALLAALMATKNHYFAAIFLPIVAMLAARLPFRTSPPAAVRSLALIGVPPLLALWYTRRLLSVDPGGGGVCQLPSGLALAREQGGPALLHFFTHGVSTAVRSSFSYSIPFESFWLGYTAYRTSYITLGTRELTSAVELALPWLSVAIALLFVVRLVQVAARLFSLARRRSFRSAARIATSNVLVNGYLCFFAILFAFEGIDGGHIPLQGRYWLPFVAAIWLIAGRLAPRALPRPFARAMGTVVFAGVLAFDIAATAFAFPSLHDRFYGPPASVAPSSELLADVNAAVRGRAVDVRGVAVDLRDASPVQRIVLRLDGATDVPARAQDRPDVLCATETTLLQSGFAASLPASHLRAGTHALAVLVETRWSGRLIDTGVHTSFVVR